MRTFGKFQFAFALLFAIAGNAFAVVVSGPDDGRTIPAGLPLGNVGNRGASSVYIDNGWVLTAGHVPAGDVIFGEETYHYDGVNNVRIKNPSGYSGLETTYTDLRLFRLTEEPDLPTLAIAGTSPVVGEAIYYAGYGTKASETLTYWTYSETEGWKESSSYTQFGGYKLIGPHEFNWGYNMVTGSYGSGGPTPDTYYINVDGVDEIAIATTFRILNGYSGAVSGDSGGAAFSYNQNTNTWMLAGIISSVGLLQETVPTQALAGNYTFSVSLAFYRDQILDIVYPEVVPGDANRDGKVDGSDVTIVAGNWQLVISGGEEEAWAAGDFNGDGFVDGSDVTILAGNWQYGVDTQASLAAAMATAFGGDDVTVPEPSVGTLIFGLLLAVCWAGRTLLRP